MNTIRRKLIVSSTVLALALGITLPTTAAAQIQPGPVATTKVHIGYNQSIAVLKLAILAKALGVSFGQLMGKIKSDGYKGLAWSEATGKVVLTPIVLVSLDAINTAYEFYTKAGPLVKKDAKKLLDKAIDAFKTITSKT